MKLQTRCPDGMVEDVYERRFLLDKEKVAEVWQQLNQRETFVDGQIFPYRVEFDAEEQRGPFLPGELNIHHGPFLSLHGAIGSVSDSYRVLEYFFGSYVVSFRFIRPVKLEFFCEEQAIRMKIHSYVKPWLFKLWRKGNDLFWKFFGITFLF